MPTNWWVPAVEDWGSAVAGAWPEVTLWEHVQSIEKTSWQEEWQAGVLVAPWVVILTPEWRPADGPSGFDYFEGEVTFYYLAADTADIVASLYERLNTMAHYLRATRFPTIQVRPGFRLSTGPGNEANRALLDQKLPVTAGGVTFTCRVPGPEVAPL